jgi:hypothetical protein
MSYCDDMDYDDTDDGEETNPFTLLADEIERNVRRYPLTMVHIAMYVLARKLAVMEPDAFATGTSGARWARDYVVSYATHHMNTRDPGVAIVVLYAAAKLEKMERRDFFAGCEVSR